MRSLTLSAVWMLAMIANSNAQSLQPAKVTATPVAQSNATQETESAQDEGSTQDSTQDGTNNQDPTLPPIEVRPGPRVPEIIDGIPSLGNQMLGSGDGRFNSSSGVLRTRGSLLDTPGAAGIRTREEIAERQAPDMFHALQNEVGVLMQSTAAGQASPFVRGLTGQQVLILVDGIRLNNSFFRRGPNQYFNTIDPGGIDHIEILRGQGSVLWGSDAIGGAINVVTRGADLTRRGGYGQREVIQYYNTANSAPYSRFNVEASTGNAGVFAGGSYMNVRDLDTGFDSLSRQPGTNYQQYAGDIKFNFLLHERAMVTFALQHFELENVPRSDRFPGYPQDRNSSNSNGGARFFDPQQRDLAYIRYQALDVFDGMFDAVTVTGSYHRQREVQTRGIPTSRVQETDVESTGVNVVAAKDDGFGKWTSGVDWYHDNVDSSFGGSASGPIVPDDAYYERLGVFVNYDVTLTETLDATAGVRYEHINTGGTPTIMGMAVPVEASYQDWVGQFGLVYHVNSCLRLVGSISEGFRAPNLDDLMANNPNVLQQGQSVPSLGLVPERSINYEIGLKGDYDRFKFQTFVYWMEIQDNMVSITAAPNTFGTANQDSFIQGVESSAEYWLDQSWSVYGNFWYTYGENLVTGAALSRIPPMQGILGLRYRNIPRRTSAALYVWMSDRQDRLDPVRDLTDERIPIGGTPGFATLNMRVARTFGCCDEHRLSVSLENITDQPYLIHGSGVLGTGFTARLGYQLTY